MIKRMKVKPPPCRIQEAIAKMLKVRMNDFQIDSNLMIKSIIETFNCIATNCSAVDETAMKVMIKFFITSLAKDEFIAE